MNRRLKLYKQAAAWIKRAAEEFDQAKAYADSGSNVVSRFKLDLSPEQKQFLVDDYNADLESGKLLDDRRRAESFYFPDPEFDPYQPKMTFIPGKWRKIPPPFENWAKNPMWEYNWGRDYLLQKGVSPRNPALDFNLKRSYVLGAMNNGYLAAYFPNGEFININPFAKPENDPNLDPYMAHEGTHGVNDITMKLGSHIYGRRPIDVFKYYYPGANPEDISGKEENNRYFEWPSSIIESIFPSNIPDRSFSFKPELSILLEPRYLQYLTETQKTTGGRDTYPIFFDQYNKAHIMPQKNEKGAVIPPQTDAIRYFPGTPMRWVVDKFGNFVYDRDRDQALHGYYYDKNLDKAVYLRGRQISTAPENVYNIYSNLSQIPRAWQQLKENPQAYFALREEIQRGLAPLYARSKPFVYAAGDSAEPSSLTVAQLVQGVLDPETGESFRKQHQKEIEALHPELINDLMSIRYHKNIPFAPTKEEFNKQVNRFREKYPEFNTVSRFGELPEGFEDLQYEFSITPGFDTPSDMRSIEQMYKILNRLRYYYKRQRYIDNFQDPREPNKDWA